VPLPQILLLFPAGILSGIVSTVAGLASLVSYPALLLAGLPPVTANISNTIALVANGAGAVLGSQKELRGQGPRLRKSLPITLAGGLAGGLVLIVAPSDSFARVVPFFIAGAALIVLFPNQVRALPGLLRRRAPDSVAPHPGPVRGAELLMFTGIFFTGMYGGYFGAAAGVIMMALLTATLDTPFTVTNALKNTLGEAANAVAAILFLCTSTPRWDAIVPLALGMFVGGYIGPRIFRRLNAVFLHWLIGLLALGLAVVLFIQAY
jgi:uncharacterized membrane protein YfcA